MGNRLPVTKEELEMKLVDVKLIPVDVPTANGRVYPREVVEKALDALADNDARMLVTLGGGMSLRDVAGQATELHLDDDGLHADIEVLDTDAGKLVKMAAAGAQFRYQLSGTCKVEDDGVVRSMTITGVDMSIESKG